MIVCVAHVLRYSPYTAVVKEVHRQRRDRRGGQRRPPRTGRLVAPGPLLRPRQLAPGGRIQPDAAGQVLPRRRLAELRGRPARGPGVVVRQPQSLHRRQQAGRRRLTAAWTARSSRTARTRPSRSISTTPTSRTPSAGRWTCWPSRSTATSITQALREGPYGRCVYDCDNDVVDHQVVNLEYTGGVTASLTMTAFTPMGFRRTRIFGTRGTLEGDGYTVDVFDFLTGRTTSTQVVDPDRSTGRRGPSRRGRRPDPELPRRRPPRRSRRHPDLPRGQPAHPRHRLGRRTGPAPRHRRTRPDLLGPTPPVRARRPRPTSQTPCIGSADIAGVDVRSGGGVDDDLAVLAGHREDAQADPAGLEQRAAAVQIELPAVPRAAQHPVVRGRRRTRAGAEPTKVPPTEPAHIGAPMCGQRLLTAKNASSDADHADRTAVDVDDPTTLACEILARSHPAIHVLTPS